MKIFLGRLLILSSIKAIKSSDILSKLLPLGKNLLMSEFCFSEFGFQHTLQNHMLYLFLVNFCCLCGFPNKFFDRHRNDKFYILAAAYLIVLSYPVQVLCKVLNGLFLLFWLFLFFVIFCFRSISICVLFSFAGC